MAKQSFFQVRNNPQNYSDLKKSDNFSFSSTQYIQILSPLPRGKDSIIFIDC